MTPTCGTYSGYQKHRKRGEKPCEECKAASREYMKDYRARHPDFRAEEMERHRARSRAVWRLAREYPVRFRQLFAEELDNPTPSKEFERDAAGLFAVTSEGAS